MLSLSQYYRELLTKETLFSEKGFCVSGIQCSPVRVSVRLTSISTHTASGNSSARTISIATNLLPILQELPKREGEQCVLIGFSGSPRNSTQPQSPPSREEMRVECRGVSKQSREPFDAIPPNSPRVGVECGFEPQQFLFFQGFIDA